LPPSAIAHRDLTYFQKRALIHHDLLTRASGYVGGAFQRELTRRGLPYRAVSRAELDYTRFRVLADALKSHRPSW